MNFCMDHHATRELIPKINLAQTNRIDEDLTTGKMA
jgi:hypothetical protein